MPSSFFMTWDSKPDTPSGPQALEPSSPHCQSDVDQMTNPIPMEALRWIVLLPLGGAIVNGLFGALIQRRYGKKAISVLACAPAHTEQVLAILRASGEDPIVLGEVIEGERSVRYVRPS